MGRQSTHKTPFVREELEKDYIDQAKRKDYIHQTKKKKNEKRKVKMRYQFVEVNLKILPDYHLMEENLKT